MSKAEAEAQIIAMCRFEELGDVGPYHLDIDGSGMSGGAPRGPFKIQNIKAGHAATFPVLYGHQAEHERTLEIEYDSQGIARIGKSAEEKESLETRRDRIWATRSRLHVNTDFRFNSQSLTVAITKDESLGGRAWPTFKMNNPDHDIVASLWFNSTLGILSYWWAANKAQDGRGSITTAQMGKLTLLDPRKLKSAQTKEAAAFFEDKKGQAFLPAHQIEVDTMRTEVDEFVLRELLNVSDVAESIKKMAVLRNKLGSEPSFHGGKVKCSLVTIFKNATRAPKPMWSTT